VRLSNRVYFLEAAALQVFWNVVDPVVTRMPLVSSEYVFVGEIAVPTKHQQPMKTLIMSTTTCQMTGVLHVPHAGHHQAEQLVRAADRDGVQPE